MKRLVLMLTVMGALLATSEAHAQFANRSITLSLGFVDLDDVSSVDWGLPLGLGATGYIDAGFEWTVNVTGMLLTQPIDRRQFIGVNGGLGLRYLFLEETLRPWAGGELVYLHLFREEFVTNYFGVAPSLGVDYFVFDTFSVGAKAQFSVYWWLNQPVTTQRGIYVVASAWF